MEKLFIVCNHRVMFVSHRYCGSADELFLIYHVFSLDQVIKVLCDFMGWSFF